MARNATRLANGRRDAAEDRDLDRCGDGPAQDPDHDPRHGQRDAGRGEHLEEADDRPPAARRWLERTETADRPVDRPLEAAAQLGRFDGRGKERADRRAGRRAAGRQGDPDRLDRRGQRASLAPANEEAVGIGDARLAPGHAVEQGGDAAHRPGAARPGPGTGRRVAPGARVRAGRPPAGPRRSPRRSRPSAPGRRGTGSTARADRRRLPGRGRWTNATAVAATCARTTALAATPSASHFRRAAEVGRSGQHSVRRTLVSTDGPPIADRAGARSASRSRRMRPSVVGTEPVGLVDDHDLASEPRQPRPQEVVMERGVVVLLRVGHPRDRVDARQDRLDPGPVFGRDRVHVRQVEDRDRPEVGGAVLADLVDAEPLEQRVERGPLGGRDPGHRHAGGRPSDGRRADGLAGQGVEQARLADAGAADESQDVGVAREPHPSDRIGMSRPDGLGRRCRAPRRRQRPRAASRGIGRACPASR